MREEKCVDDDRVDEGPRLVVVNGGVCVLEEVVKFCYLGDGMNCEAGVLREQYEREQQLHKEDCVK